MTKLVVQFRHLKCGSNLSNFLKYVTGSFQHPYLNYCKSYDSPLKFNLIFSSWWWCPCATTLTEFPLNFCDLGLVLMALYSIHYCEFCDVVRWCKKIICKNCESGTQYYHQQQSIAFNVTNFCCNISD